MTKPQTTENSEAYLKFFLQVLQTTDESGADPQVVYPLLAVNLEKLDATLVEVLRRWATDSLARIEPDEAQYNIAANILNFSALIQQFPLGDRASNIEIAIAGYEMALIVFTLDEFPEDWADVQSNMGTAYRDRIIGDRADNIEQAIAIHTAVLEVRTRGSEEWAGTQMNLGAAYLGRIVGNRADNIEQAITAFTAASEVFTRNEFPQQWVMIQNNLGVAYRNTIIGDRGNNIEKAITACTDAVEVCRTRKEVHEQWGAMAQITLGNAYSERIRGNREDNLEEAIKAYTAALEFYTSDRFPQQWAMIQNNLGNAYLFRIHDSRADNLEKAIIACNAALKVRTRQALPLDWAETQNNLGNAYLERILGEKADNLERAISAYTAALEVYTRNSFPERWALIQNNLGVIYRNRIVGDKAENIELAIAACKAALEVYTRDIFPQQWAATQNTLASAYYERILGDEAENIEFAIAACKQVLQVYTSDSFPEYWATTQDNLGNAYRKRIFGDEAENIELAINAFTAALEVRTRDDLSQYWAMTKINIGVAYRDKILGNEAENIELAINAFTDVLEVLTPNSSPYSWAAAQNNLGGAYHKMRKHRNTGENILKAFQAYSAALEVYTRDAFPINHVEIKYNLGTLYQDERRFADAYAIFKYAIEIVELFREEIVSGDEAKRKQAEKWNLLYRRMVEVCLAQNNIAEAIEYVERSKTRTLVELILERDFKTIFPLEIATQLEELRDKIASGQDQLQNRTAKNPEALAQNLQEWRQQRNDLQNSKLPIGYSFKFKDFQETLDEHTTVIEWYITGTSKTAFETFIITHNSLQWFNVSSEADERNAFVNWLNEYGEGYYEKNNEWKQNLSSHLIRLAEILHLEGILELVPKNCSRLVLIPHMLLHIFPLHALPLANGDFLCDRFFKNVNYVPSCQLLQQLQPLQRPEFQRLFAVQTPTEDLYEQDLGAIAAIKKQFNETGILKKAKATKSEIYRNEELYKANCIFFFCHGYFNPDSPLDSGLQLAGEDLTLKDIIVDLKLNNCRLVMLSACETGLPDFMNTSDEYIGLPYGFLLAGSTNVVSSLWTVSATATALLSIKFYEELQQQSNIAVALNTAQCWLRDTTVQEFRDWLVRSQLEKVWQRQLGKYFNEIQTNQGATVKPFEQPYYWAAFCAIGKGV